MMAFWLLLAFATGFGMACLFAGARHVELRASRDYYEALARQWEAEANVEFLTDDELERMYRRWVSY